MAALTFDISLGAVAEKVRDGATAVGVLLLKVAEADTTLRTRATVAAILAAANTEADFTNYARKTGITATLSVDTVNHRAEVDLPDQTWASAGGATNNSLVKLIVFYDQGGTDATRIPLTMHGYVHTTVGTDLPALFAASGIYRAQVT